MGPLKGATIVKQQTNDEAGKKLREVKKAGKFEEFLAIMKKQEEESLKPLSGDHEVITNVDEDLLKELQVDKRLVGYDPKTKTAFVLKVAFLAKKAKKESK